MAITAKEDSRMCFYSGSMSHEAYEHLLFFATNHLIHADLYMGIL